MCTYSSFFFYRFATNISCLTATMTIDVAHAAYTASPLIKIYNIRAHTVRHLVLNSAVKSKFESFYLQCRPVE